MAEKEQESRHKIAEFVLPESAKTFKRSQYFAFVWGLSALAAAVLVGIWGNPWIAGGIGISGFLLPLIGIILRSILDRNTSANDDDIEDE